MDLLDIKMLNTAIEAMLNRRLAPVSLTYAQGTVLELLARSAGREVAQKDLEEWLGLSHPTVNSILSRMLDKGLITVETSRVDRRRKRVQLTEQGRQLASRVSQIVGGISDEIFAGLSKTDVEKLSFLVRRITENVRGMRPA